MIGIITSSEEHRGLEFKLCKTGFRLTQLGDINMPVPISQM